MTGQKNNPKDAKKNQKKGKTLQETLDDLKGDKKTGSKDENQTDPKDLKIEESQVKIKELEDKNLRLSAEMQNVVKQNELNLVSAKKLGKRVVAQGFLEFLNTMNISFSFVPKTDDQKVLSFVETMKNSFEKLLRELPDLGVEIIAPKPGDPFDPQTMSILDGVASGETPKVKHIVNIGLKVDGQVIQAASVMID